LRINRENFCIQIEKILKFGLILVVMKAVEFFRSDEPAISVGECKAIACAVDHLEGLAYLDDVQLAGSKLNLRTVFHFMNGVLNVDLAAIFARVA
jgi:hypothetical protein